MAYLIFIFPIFLLLKFVSKKENGYVYVGFCSLAICTLIVTCFRSPYEGYDIGVYYSAYYRFIGEESEYVLLPQVYNGWERGYILLNILLGKLFGDISINCFMSVFAFLILVPIFTFIWRNATYPFFSMALFVAAGGIMSACNTLRQQCALVIVLLSFKCMQRGNSPMVLLITTIACFFHRSAIVIILFYLFYYNIRRINITIKLLMFSLIGAFLLYIGMGVLYSYILPFTRMKSALQAVGNYGHVLVLWGSLVFSLMLDKSINRDESKKFYYLMLLFSGIVQIVALNGGELSRLNKYFIFPLCFILPDAMKAFFCKHVSGSAFWTSIMIDICLVIMFATTFLASYGQYYELSWNTF